MTNEQREAIDRLNKDKNKPLACGDIIICFIDDLDTVLSLIKEQAKKIENLQKELNEENNRCMILANNDKFKEQIIEAMIEEYEYNERINLKDFCDDEMRKDKCIEDCKNCIKQYFAGLVEKE